MQKCLRHLKPAIATLCVSHSVLSDSESLLTEQKSAKSSLQSWRSGSTLDNINRRDHDVVDPKRRVLVVVGITGSGKSSTANTLAGRTHKQFSLSNSVTSVTQSVSFRDYDFVNETWRIIDTPGLCDTNKKPEEVHGELERLARYSPHGIAAFVVVVPRGRFTAEQEYALRELLQMFGDGMKRFSLVAVTGATDASEGRNLLPRDQLIDEINNLPLKHFYRQFVEDLRLRLVPVENRTEPHRQISRMTLHQRVLDIETALNGERYDSSALTQRNLERKLKAMEQAAISTGAKQITLADFLAGSGLQLGQCMHTLDRKKTDGKLTMTLQCDVME